MSTTVAVRRVDVAGGVVKGAIAGLGGGVVFGAMMAVMGMLPMVAGLVGSQSAAVGAVVHMLISAAIGAFYGAVLSLGRFAPTLGLGVVSGVVNGFVWWVLGALILMPLGLGMTAMVLQVGEMQWMSLLGHVIYGIVTGLVYIALTRRA
jgi:hypothetical protein